MNLYYRLEEDDFPVIPPGDEPGKSTVDLPIGSGGDGSRQPSSLGYEEDENGAAINPPSPSQGPKNN